MRPLAVDADLDLTVAGHPVAVRGAGREVVVDVDSARTAWRLFRSHRPGADLTRGVVGALQAADVDVHVRVAGHRVGRLGPEARPGRLSRLLGLPDVELRLSAFLRALFGRA